MTSATSNDDLVDLLIIGGGPAGIAAALTAAQSGLSCRLIDRRLADEGVPMDGWLSPGGIALCEKLGISAQAAKAQPYNGLKLYTWDFSEQTQVQGDDLVGWHVDRMDLGHAIDDVLRSSGVTLELGHEVVGLTLGEDDVTLDLADEGTRRGRILLIADGVFSRMAEMAELKAAGQTRSLLRCAQMVTNAPGAKPGLAVALGRERGSQLATIVTSTDRVRITVSGQADPNDLMRSLGNFCESAVEAGIIPKTEAQIDAGGVLPAAAALDMDNHVGKRCLLIGDAGGFVAAFSNEGIFPAMRSGCIAAEVAAEALKADVLQDTLATFGVVWRQEMAEYLRMPNADLGLLLPLIFRSQPMATRIARAFLLGAEL